MGCIYIKWLNHLLKICSREVGMNYQNLLFILSLVIPIALASVLLERIVEIILEASGVTPTLMPFIFIIFSIPVGVWVWLALASLYHVVSVSRMVVSSGSLPFPNRPDRLKRDRLLGL